MQLLGCGGLRYPLDPPESRKPRNDKQNAGRDDRTKSHDLCKKNSTKKQEHKTSGNRRELCDHSDPSPDEVQGPTSPEFPTGLNFHALSSQIDVLHRLSPPGPLEDSVPERVRWWTERASEFVDGRKRS